MASPIPRRKLSDEVAVRIEEAIRSNQYPVGSFLPSERELMTLYDVGRPSVREALHALGKMGLVRVASGERPRVTRPTPHDMLEHLSGAARLLLDEPGGVVHFEQLRLFLEESVARHAATHATPAQVAALEEALAANEAAIPRAKAFAATDVAFHHVLMAVPQNPIFPAVHQALVAWLISQRTPRTADPLLNQRSFEGHRRVVEAIRSHDADGAGLAMRRHLEEAALRYAPRRKDDAQEGTTP